MTGSFAAQIELKVGKEADVSTIKRAGNWEHFSDYVEFNGVVSVRGVTANDRNQPIKGQTEDCLRQIDALLANAGTDKTKLLTSTVYLSSMQDKDGMNAIWTAWLAPDARPTRATVQAQLGTSETLIEIVVSAAK